MNSVELRYRQFRESLGPLKTAEDSLSTSLANRHELLHHNHKRGVPRNHLPTQRVFRSKPKIDPSKPKGYQAVDHTMLPGEVPIKVWAMAEAARCGVAYNSIWARIKSGKYPDVRFRRVNARVVFVSVNAELSDRSGSLE